MYISSVDKLIQYRQLFYAALCSAVASILSVVSQTAQAQVIPDDTLGAERSIVTSVTDSSFSSQQIEGGAVRGTNLFHSFREFNIGEGQSLYFQNPTGVQNIISRITGESLSNIEGTLGVLNGDSNVYLLNPNGILFGENARLDVRGSFIATTAPMIQFGSQGFFSSAASDSPSLLTVSPSAFLFSQTTPSAIVNRSTAPLASGGKGLQVPIGESLLLLGGGISLLGGGVNAPEGRLELGAVAGEGIVGVGLDSQGHLRLSYPNRIARADVSLSNGATVDTSGEGGGPIHILGRQVLLNSGAQIASFTQGGTPGGSLTVNASESLELVGLTSNGIISTLSFGPGRAGDISIETQKLRIREEAQVISGAFGAGQAGQMTVNASDFIEIVGEGSAPNSEFSGIASITGGAERAGDLTVNTGRLILSDQGFLSTESIESISEPGSTGEQTTVASGQAGDLTVNASDSVTLSNQGFIFTGTQGSGNAGDLTINTDRLLIEQASRISTESLGSGNAGDITVQAQSINLSDRSEVNTVTTESQGGNIALQVSDFILLRQNSLISTEAGTAQAGGDGGDITLDLPNGFVIAVPSENSDIRANAFEGDGGNVNITASSLLGITFQPELLDTPFSDITASSQFGSSGTVTINEINPNTPRLDTELPAETAPPSLARGCLGPNSQTGSFVITGRGGLPKNPTDSHNINVIWQDVDPINITGTVENSAEIDLFSPQERSRNSSMVDEPIIEAQGWTRAESGLVVLTTLSTQVNNPLGQHGSCERLQGADRSQAVSMGSD